MARRSGLGKGLGALIPSDVTGAAPAGPPADGASSGGPDLREVPVTSIRPNRYQPRQAFDEEALASLAASIAELGVLQPVLVRPLAEPEGEVGYELIAGERRWRAARRVGLPTVPAIIRDVTDLASMEQAVVENLHRRDLNPLEEAAAFQQLLGDFGLTHEQLAKRVGKSRTAVTNTLRLFNLPSAVQRMVRDGELAEGHARALLGLDDPDAIERAATRVVADGLSVRATEALVRGGPAAPQRPPTAPTPSGPEVRPAPGATKEPGLLELEELLGDLLSTRVKVELGPAKGRVVIEFADLDDLERIYRAMTAG